MHVPDEVLSFDRSDVLWPDRWLHNKNLAVQMMGRQYSKYLWQISSNAVSGNKQNKGWNAT